MFDLLFFIKSIGLGAGLAMDAFSVSLANGLNEPCMKKRRLCGIAGVFAFFQFLMPMVGWVCVHTFLQYFSAAQKCIPWVALLLLGYIGGKMLLEGIKTRGCPCSERAAVGTAGLVVQGVATSIDALSVGFTIANYNLLTALACGLVIAAVTFVICTAGLFIGKKAGTCLAGKASVLGGAILILIGLEIFITGIF